MVVRRSKVVWSCGFGTDIKLIIMLIEEKALMVVIVRLVVAREGRWLLWEAVVVVGWEETSTIVAEEHWLESNGDGRGAVLGMKWRVFLINF